jgi:hypothetical protein
MATGVFYTLLRTLLDANHQLIIKIVVLAFLGGADMAAHLIARHVVDVLAKQRNKDIGLRFLVVCVVGEAATALAAIIAVFTADTRLADGIMLLSIFIGGTFSFAAFQNSMGYVAALASKAKTSGNRGRAHHQTPSIAIADELDEKSPGDRMSTRTPQNQIYSSYLSSSNNPESMSGVVALEVSVDLTESAI